jgi:hypothetical protein
MRKFFKSLRRGRDDHREVFAEFAMVMIFLRAEQLAMRKGGARLRVVR